MTNRRTGRVLAAMLFALPCLSACESSPFAGEPDDVPRQQSGWELDHDVNLPTQEEIDRESEGELPP